MQGQPKLIVKDIRRNPICILNYGKNLISNLEVRVAVNEIGDLSFRLSPSDWACKYVGNENLIEFEGETYIIKSVRLVSDEVSYYEVMCKHESIILLDKACGKMEFIAETVASLMNKALEGTGFSFTGTDIPNTTKRHLFTDSGTSVFDVLTSIAENFGGAKLKFETFEIPNGNETTIVRGVGLYEGIIDNGRYFRYGKDLNNVDIEYNTENLITQLTVFGENDKVTGIPITMAGVNDGKIYLEDYTFFTNMGISLEECQSSPRFKKEGFITETTLTTPQMILDYGKNELKRLSVPTVTVNCSVLDLHQFEEYMLEPLSEGETVYILDERVNFEGSAMLSEYTKNYDNPLQSNIVLTNMVEKKSALKDLANVGQVVDKVINGDGTIHGGVIIDGTFHANKIVANSIDTIHLKADSIKTEQLSANSVTAKQIQAGSITAGSGIIAEGAIGSAEISELSANKLSAGTIDASKVEINGDGSAMRIKGNQILAIDNTDLLNQKVKAIFGEYKKEDNSTTHGLAIYGKNGSLMIDEDGVHKGGVMDNSIGNTQISNDANIDGSKLNIKTTITAINNDTGADKINSVKINVDGKSLDVELKEYNTLITTNSKNIQTNTSDIQANSREIALKVGQQSYLEDKQQFQNNLNDISNKIDGLQVGGNNLMVGTKDWATAKWNNVDLTGEVYVGGKIAKVKGMYPNTPSTSMSRQQLKFKIGESYTVQVEAKAKVQGLKLGVSIDSTKINYDEKVIDNTKFTKYTWTFTSEKEDLDIFRFDSSNATSTNYIEVAKCKVELGSVATDWTPSYDDIYLSIEETKQQIADIVADDKFMPNEKYDIKREIDSIKAEKIQIENQCLIYPQITIELNDYLVSYNSLIDYISPYITVGNINETSLIDPDTFSGMFNTYYDRRSKLIIELDKATKQTIDSVQAEADRIEGLVNNAQGELNDIQNINKLTPNEKQNMKIQWEAIKKTYTQNISLADYYNVTGVERNNYTNSYNALRLVIEPCLVSENMDKTTVIDGVDIANKQVDYYDKEAIFNRIISQKVKLDATDIANSSLQEAKDYADGKVSEVTGSLDGLVGTIVDGALDGFIDEVEGIAIKNDVARLNSKKIEIDKAYTSLYTNQYLLGAVKADLKTKYDTFVTAHSTLIYLIDTYIADNILTPEEAVAFNNQVAVYNNALGEYNITQNNALDNIALNQAKKEVSDMKAIIDGDIQGVTEGIAGLEESITNAVKDGIIDETEKMILSDNIKSVEKDKASLDKQYTSLYSNVNLKGTAKTNLLNSKNGYNTAFTNYKNYINELITKITIIEADLVELARLKGLYDTAFSLLEQRINEALDNIATNKVNEVKSQVDDIISDSKFTPNEKQLVDRDLTEVKNEYPKYIATADILNISTERNAYAIAYNSYVNYFEPMLGVNINVTSDINPTEFKNAINNYVDKRNILLKKIEDINNDRVSEADRIANLAKQEAEKSMGEINAMGSDSKVTPVEKLSIKDRWEEIKKEYTSILNQANQYNVSTITYTSKYNTLSSYLVGTGGILVNMGVTSDIVRTTYQTKFNDYFVSRQTVLDNISIESKKAINQVLVDSKVYTDGEITTVNKQFEVVNAEIVAVKDSIKLTVTKDELAETVTTITNNQSYLCKVVSSHGDKFINGDINTALEATVFRGREDVTTSFQNNQFLWERISSDTDGDIVWNTAHLNIGRRVVITRDDFRKCADFKCTILDENGNRVTEA